MIDTQQLVDACKNINPDIIEIKEKEDSFDFTIELWGQLTAQEILEEAFRILDDKLESFEKQISKIK